MKTRNCPYRRPHICLLLAAMVLLCGGFSAAAQAQLELRNATTTHLDNGLTVVMLPDRNFPVVSVQMLYRVGARDELTGKTGLAHFLEHLAFRSSEAFPGTGLVDAIYAVGGEWHGYTWTDLTTYFATAPRTELDLLLRIEAERMHRLELDPAVMAAERNAVFTEMRLYENDPASLLVDAALLTSFSLHPYRHNSIGWESDVANIEHADVVDFYQRYYHPANAVLAIVGDFDPAAAMASVQHLFGDIPAGAAASPPITREPAQHGERRSTVQRGAWPRQLRIAYRAPASSHPDAAAFLVLQELLGGGSGISFLQNDWGTAVRPGSLLEGAAADLTTWYPPSADDFVFMIGASAGDQQSDAAVEAAIEAAVSRLRSEPPSPEPLRAAIGRVKDELVFDVQTTEDAAHQLAYFAGIHALDVLFSLPQRVAAVTPADIERVARTWLRPEQRSIVWLHPAANPAPGLAPNPGAGLSALEHGSGAALPGPAAAAIDTSPLPPPQLHLLDGGLPVLSQVSDLSDTAHLQLVFRGTPLDHASARNHDPVIGYSSLVFAGRAAAIDMLLEQAETVLKQGLAVTAAAPPDPRSDPAGYLEQALLKNIDAARAVNHNEAAQLALVVVSGDVVTGELLPKLKRAFGTVRPPASAPAAPARPAATHPATQRLHLRRPLAQAQLGYVAAVAGPQAEGYLATRFLQYLLAHEYQGRFGDEAVSARGLAYYLDHRYRSDGQQGWATLAVGVNPENLDALSALWLETLQDLNRQPPTAAELESARRYYLGRLHTAAQSNSELAETLAVNWLWHKELHDPQLIDARLRSVSHQQLLDAVPALINGLTITVGQ